jgi:hypothetical protein
MKLFDFVKILFSTSSKYEKLTKYERGKNRFMMMRFMAINYPEAANLLNWNGTDPAYVNDSFRLVGKQFKRTPGWVYTKVRATKKNKVDYEPKESTLQFYLTKNESNMRDYIEVLKSPRKAAMLKELEDLEKLLDDNGYESK